MSSRASRRNADVTHVATIHDAETNGAKPGPPARLEFESLDRERLDLAVNALLRTKPVLSAAGPLAPWQRGAFIGVLALCAASEFFAAGASTAIVAALLTVPFAMIVVVRFAAVWQLMTEPGRRAPAPPLLADVDLPDYTVLVPLYHERDVAPALVHALSALDYPAEKIDIIFVTEEMDVATRLALAAACPPPHMRIITVPAGEPRTKPRALSSALQFSGGELVTVYDAEDIPAPDQLRQAAAVFAASDSNLACVQARLSIYNPKSGFLTRQFALEYEVLFGAILPLMQRLRLPVLLGGTSNHFRRSVLEGIGGWDPFNVTEDADLGIRLARSGYRVAMFGSDTAEEAPFNWRAWCGQRRRWLKGWMQTYAVHMREPRQLWRELGPSGFMGVQVMLGGMLLSAMMHPLFYLVAAVQLSTGKTILPSSGGAWVLCWSVLLGGYAAGIVLNLIAAWRSQGRLPLGSALFVPLYWLAISIACYQALIEFFLRPYYWEKTPHQARAVTTDKVAT